MALGAAGFQHIKVFLLETVFGIFINVIKRIDQTIAKRIGVNVKR